MTIGGYTHTRMTKAQPPKAVNEFEVLMAKQEPRIRRALQEAYETIRNELDMAEVTRAIQTGDTDDIVQMVRPFVTNNALQEFAAALSASTLAGSALAAEVQVPVRNLSGDVVNFVFDAANPHISRFAQNYTTRRVREIGEDVRAIIREVIRSETTLGANPLQTARRIRESIGLTVRQERAVFNFRRMLQIGDAEALTRRLRDRRFDSTVERSIADGVPLTQKQVDRMVARYRARYIKYRSETIARTEALRTVNGANNTFLQSYVDTGQIAAQQVKRFWHYSQDDKTRPAHRMIPSMNPEGVGLYESFRTPLGPLQYPGDPDGEAANVINCRCVAFNRVLSAELLEGLV